MHDYKEWAIAFVIALLLFLTVFWALKAATSSQVPLVVMMSDEMQHTDDFDMWWEEYKGPFIEKYVYKHNFSTFPHKEGISRGSLLLVRTPDNIDVGDVLVFRDAHGNILVQRVVDHWVEYKPYYGNITLFQTMPDEKTSLGEKRIAEHEVYGTVALEIPFLGYPGLMINKIKRIIL